MMALLYAVQGSFWPLLAVHLGELGIDGRWRGLIFASQALAAAVVPLAAGQLVDRLMSTRRYLILAYGLGALILAILASGWVDRPGWLFVIFLVFWAIIAPTNGLSNSLAMRNLDNPRREFGAVRLWGTIGWMVVGWLVSGVMLAAGGARTTSAGAGGMHEVFAVAAGLSLVMALYCRLLPETPPLATALTGRANLRQGLAVARRSDVRVFFITTFGLYLTMPLVLQVMPSYLAARGLSRPWIASAMTLGQVLEIAVLFVLPWLLGRIGVKWTIVVGLAAWSLRFLTLAVNPPLWLAVGGGLLHGVGYGCFTIGGQVFLDGAASKTHRASAQALFLIVSSGMGSLLGSLWAGEQTRGDASNLANNGLVFLLPFLLTTALLIYFATRFRASRTDESEPAESRRDPAPFSPREKVAGSAG